MWTAGALPTWASKEVMLSLTSSVSRQSCRIWHNWNNIISSLLAETAPYNVCSGGDDGVLNAKWITMVQASLLGWENNVVYGQAIIGEEENDDENEREDIDEDEFDDAGKVLG